jgi:hypothetical protein
VTGHIAAVVVGAMLIWSATVCADGRYQVVPLDAGYEFGTEKAMIIDTVAGHIWIWIESPAVNGNPGGRYVIYQGQVVPGKQMGDIILKQEWDAEDPGD